MKGIKTAVLALALLLIATALSCGHATAYPYTIKGYVIDENGHPMQGADITMNSPSALSPLILNGTTDQTGYYTVSVGINEPQGLAASGETVSVFAVNGDLDASTSFVIPQNASGTRWLNITLQGEPQNPITQPSGLAVIGLAVASMAVLGIWLFVRRKNEAEADRKKEGSGEKAVPKRRRRKP